MRFLSVCSGIEAASVAWHPLGWRAWSFSEIDPHASTVLRWHFPHVPNLGDMTKYEEWPLEPIDLLCGGTPCQAFSLAGLRKGLDDPRGNLMLTFGAIARRYLPRWLVWENVPGVLSSNEGRDFGAFLGMLGLVGYGFAYRVLDARHFGLAQRRERVFLVGHLGAWQPAAAVLFERDSLRRHPSARRGAGGGDTGPVAPCLDATGVAAGQSLLTRPREVARASEGRRRAQVVGGFSAYNLGTDFVEETSVTMTASTAPLIGFSQRGLKENGSWQEGVSPSLQCEAPVVMQGFAGFSSKAKALTDMVPTLAAANAGSVVMHQQRKELLCVNVSAGRQGIHSGQVPNQSTASILTSMTANAMAVIGARAFQHHRAGGLADVAPTLTAHHNEHPGVMGFSRHATVDGAHEEAPTMTRGTGPVMVEDDEDLRKLTPIECERLQGFPDGWTAVPTRRRNKLMEEPGYAAYQRAALAHLGYTEAQLMTVMPDGPRYKMIGNSWAVPCARWVGRRIAEVEELLLMRDQGLL